MLETRGNADGEHVVREKPYLTNLQFGFAMRRICNMRFCGAAGVNGLCVLIIFGLIIRFAPNMFHELILVETWSSACLFCRRIVPYCLIVLFTVLTNLAYSGTADNAFLLLSSEY